MDSVTYQKSRQYSIAAVIHGLYYLTKSATYQKSRQYSVAAVIHGLYYLTNSATYQKSRHYPSAGYNSWGFKTRILRREGKMNNEQVNKPINQYRSTIKDHILS